MILSGQLFKIKTKLQSGNIRQTWSLPFWVCWCYQEYAGAWRSGSRRLDSVCWPDSDTRKQVCLAACRTEQSCLPLVCLTLTLSHRDSMERRFIKTSSVLFPDTPGNGATDRRQGRPPGILFTGCSAVIPVKVLFFFMLFVQKTGEKRCDGRWDVSSRFKLSSCIFVADPAAQNIYRQVLKWRRRPLFHSVSRERGDEVRIEDAYY